MSPVVTPHTTRSRELLPGLVAAGLVTAIIDGLFSSVLNVAAYGSTVARLFQGVAAAIVGNSAFTGGARSIALGLLVHVGVAFGWSAVFVLAVTRSAWIRGVLASRYGPLKVAAVYGPAIWLVMSLLTIPLLTRRMPVISIRWWVQFFGHFPFVGLPIVALGSMGVLRSERNAASAMNVPD